MPPPDIRSAIHAVTRGETWLAPLLMSRLLREYADRRLGRDLLLDQLTERESDVLRQVASQAAVAAYELGLVRPGAGGSQL